MSGPAIIDDKTYSEFDHSNMSNPFEYNGQTWLSVEQLYQAEKFSNPTYREKIRTTTNYFTVVRLGQTLFESPAIGYPNNSVGTMYEAVYARIEQNPKLRKILAGTTGDIFYPGAGPFWGTSVGRGGANHAGENLRKIREELAK
jgi:predicted NAD-dependent protein-ADP-ribosyltransferase YbiA (DUF1768 family)